MVFSSITFLFLFLPIVLIVVYGLNIFFAIIGGQTQRHLASLNHICNLWLLLCSIIFYSWGEGSYIFVMLTSSSVDYLAALVIAKAWNKGTITTLTKESKRDIYQKTALVLSILLNIGVLAYFKYFNFGIENLNALLSFVGAKDSELINFAKVTLPLGISFYTFQSLSYTIDVYRGEARATRSYIDFICYVTLFPQLVAGPIVRYRDVAHELANRKLNLEEISQGIVRFTIGLAKKVLIANQMGLVADKIFAIPNSELTFALSWLGVICYSFQIYFDFSGYSDMAIGMGHMLGFKFLENFNYPYIAKSVKDFWRRWHISLSTWFRDYLYIPLGGNRCSNSRQYFNLFTVFFLCGLWHGAAWNFILWGMFHGAFLILETTSFSKWLERRNVALRHCYCLFVVMFGWVMFRSADMKQLSSFLSAMFGFGKGEGLLYYPELYLRPLNVVALILAIFVSIPLSQVVINRADQFRISQEANSRQYLEIFFGLLRVAFVFVLLFISALFLSSGAYNPFIYFRF